MTRNWTTKIIVFSILITGILAGLLLIREDQNISERASPATTLSIIPVSQDVNIGDTFTQQVAISSGENKITGIDIVITYDSTKIQIIEVNGTNEIHNFGTIIKNEIDNNIGKLRYAAFTFNKDLAISGNLNILTLSGRVPSSSEVGTYQIMFDPETVVVASDEGQNVVTNSQGAEVRVTNRAGEPNACGGTCGSNNNCQANYFCYQGFCRNPSCQSDQDCVCNLVTNAPAATARTTTRPAATTRPIATALPTVRSTGTPQPKGGTDSFVVNSTPDPYSDILNSPMPIDKDDKEGVTNKLLSGSTLLLFGFFALILGSLSIYIISKVFKSNKPHILPPTNI